jgi:HNH endonuclease
MHYNPVGCCIYCGSTVYSANEPARKLGDEHIIPQSIGGKDVLLEASCHNCERITSQLETKCVAALFEPGRAHLGIYGRKRKKPRLKAPMQTGSEGHIVQLALHDHPGILMMFRFSLPAALFCLDASEEITGQVMVAPAVSDLNERIKRTAAGLHFRLGGGISAETFGRMLAKIAHAFAVAELGIDGFKPLLPPVIIGDPPYRLARFVGSGLTDEPKSKDCHETGISYPHDVQGTKLVQVRIRLFGDRSCPAHYVVAGTPL